MTAQGTLIVARGARSVTLEELSTIEAPPPQGRFFPIKHSTVLTRVKDTLGDAGFVVKKEQLAISNENARFFGVLDLESALSDDVFLSVAVRSSVDKSLPLGFAAGSRVLCCSNLAFNAELLVRRKHTRFGEQRFGVDIANAVVKLNAFKEDESRRIALMKRREISGDAADSLILRAFERDIVNSHSLPKVIKEWREPSYDEFKSTTYWSLFNAFTTALREKAESNPQQYALLTMRLNSLMAMWMESRTLDAHPTLAV
jgi:hypothetical protein